jgi:hypothetical protein
MAALGTAVARGWRGALHRHPRIDLVSRIDEPVGDFLRRCRALVGNALRAGAVAQDSAAAELHRLEAETESRVLGAEHTRLLSLEARIGWYPEGVQPDLAAGALMVSGEARRGR